MEDMFKSSGKSVVKSDRYEELLAREEELRLLKKALCGAFYYSDVDVIKRIFNVESEETNND